MGACASSKGARGPRLPARPYASQVLRRAEAGFSRYPLEIEAALSDELLCEGNAYELHIVERRATRVLREESCQVARARTRDAREVARTPRGCRVTHNGVLHAMYRRVKVIAVRNPRGQGRVAPRTP